MASRENQGLHIALILLIMLTVALCLTSYVFYSKSETRRGEAEDAKNRLNQAESDLRTALFKAQTLEYMISGGAKTWSEIADALVNIPGGDGDDPTMAQIRKNHQDNMMLYGAAEEEHESARNYESLPSFLLARIRDLNQQLTDLRRSENDLTAQKNQLEQAAAERSKKFEDAEQQARNDLAAEREKFSTDLAGVRKQKDDLANQMGTKDNRIVELNTQLEDQRKAYDKRIEDLEKTVFDQKNLLKNLQQESFEVPDAVVTTINQKEGVVYINVGAADDLRVQQTFSVFDKGTTGIMQAKPKGRIEVMQLVGEHVAMCRVLEDSLSNIILPGDVVFTPAWSPGQKIHFAIAGLVDITGNGKNDVDLLESLININGGEVDEEVTVQTRYLIQGENRNEGPDPTPTSDQTAAYNNKIVAATQIGVDRLSVDKLLSLMGWRADVESVRLGSGASMEAAGTGEAVPEEPGGAAPSFRKRTPPRGADGAF
jgi:hypothetical protein